MGRFYLRSLRTAAFLTCFLLAVMASFYFRQAPPDANGLNYERVWQFFNLATAVACALPLLQGFRAGTERLFGRLQTPAGRFKVDSWAAQVWGPLMLENLIYGGWLLICLAFVWRYQARLPVPEPWQGAYPPYYGPDPRGLVLIGKMYLCALVLTVAGAYANLLCAGGALVLFWGLFCLFVPAPAAALGVLVIMRLLALMPPPEPEEGRRRPSTLMLLAITSFLLVIGAVLVPNFIRAGTRGHLTACKSNLKNIGTALEMYSTDHEGRYPTSPALLTPNYLKTIPTCPSVGWVTYQFQMASSPDVYTVVCAGRNHKNGGIDAYNYPQYTSVNGLLERP